MPTEISDKKLEDYDAMTPDQDREVPIYDSEGEVLKYWHARRFGVVVVVAERKPGKPEKLVCITDYHGVYGAECSLEKDAKARANRVPIIRREKAEAKLSKLIEESGTPIAKLVRWAYNANASYLFLTEEETIKDAYHSHEERLKEPREKQIERIMGMLRHKGVSYFGGLKLARHFISQIKPGGLGDQLMAGAIQMVESNLIPWAYVAGHLGEPVVLVKEPRKLARGLIERHLTRRHDDMDFYPEGTTAETLLDTLYSRFVEDVKPDVLDAMTLE